MAGCYEELSGVVVVMVPVGLYARKRQTTPRLGLAPVYYVCTNALRRMARMEMSGHEMMASTRRWWFFLVYKYPWTGG